jgi:gliding motility-associated-like protein
VVLCPGDTLILSAPPTDALITWQDGSGTEIYYATQPQTYSLTLSNLCGTTTDALTLSIDDRIPEIALDPQLALCDGESIVLDVTQPFDAEYVWSTGSVLPVIEIATPGDYAVSVSTDCQLAQESVHIALSADCNNEIYIPNIFSPNGDGINDVWTVNFGSDLHIISVQCRIFDRWGTLLHEATSLPVIWDGRYRGEAMLPGVYVYTIHLRFVQGSEERERVMAGDVMLVR